ncbi:MAG: Spy/CpxP family protein refolding chaperone [Candidatus Thiodiazotropha sp.]
MAHANPVPNYVAYIKKNPEALNISKEQMDQVMAWNKANGPKMHDMVMSVIETEKKMAEASMAGVSAEEIMAMADELGKTRLEIIAGKTRCRDRMLEILNDEQWGKLTALVKSR